KWSYLKRVSLYGVLVGGVLLVVPVAFDLAGPQHINGAPNAPAALATLHADLLGPVLPEFVDWFATPAVRNYADGHLVGSFAIYLGIPLCLMMVASFVLLRKRGIVLMAGSMVAISLVLSLGSVLYVGGHDTHIPLPFVVLAHLPLLDGLLATRFALFTALFGAALVAVGFEALYCSIRRSSALHRISSSGKTLVATGSVLVVALVVALPLVPSAREAVSATDAYSYFTSASATVNIPPGSAVLSYPYADSPAPGVFSFSHRSQGINDVLLNQAVAGMPFKLIGSYGWRPSGGTNGTASPSQLYPVGVQALFDLAFYGVPTAPGQVSALAKGRVGDLRVFLHQHHVATVVVLPVGQYPDMVRRVVTAAIGEPSEVDGVAVWYDVPRRLQTTVATAGPLITDVAPKTRILAPVPGRDLHGGQWIVADASSRFGIKRVVLRVTGDGRTMTEPAGRFPYGWLGGWNTKTVPNGSYTVTSVAYDGLGGTTNSAGVHVTVDN
ncbi:MAG: hypothetical protein ACRDYE_13735, partial [Acidimicrobiales bacterium]